MPPTASTGQRQYGSHSTTRRMTKRGTGVGAKVKTSNAARVKAVMCGMGALAKSSGRGRGKGGY
jgi:hypothetical protein